MNKPTLHEIQTAQIAKLPKTLGRWLEANREKWYDVDYGAGFNTDSGFAYDVGLRAGWRAGDDCVHSIIEQTAAETLSKLRDVVPCDCADCKKEKVAEDTWLTSNGRSHG